MNKKMTFKYNINQILVIFNQFYIALKIVSYYVFV